MASANGETVPIRRVFPQPDRALAVFGVISSVFCAACNFVFIIFPDFARVVNLWWFDSPMGSSKWH